MIFLLILFEQSTLSPKKKDYCGSVDNVAIALLKEASALHMKELIIDCRHKFPNRIQMRTQIIDDAFVSK